jgi:hypothetical protein
VTALERTIALHFLRTGQFDTAGIFLQVRLVAIVRRLLTKHIHRKLV